MSIVNRDKEKVTKKKFDLKEVIKNVESLKVLLKETSRKKKEIEKNFLNKFKELQKWFDKEKEKLEKLEIQLILWWDFWRKEIEINRLQKQAGIGVLPSEREKIDKEIKILNDYNKEIEKGFKGGKIDAEIIAKLRKEIEEELEKEEN